MRVWFGMALVWTGVGVAQAQDCGLAAPAFCETFEAGPAPVAERGRAGELPRARFSVGRLVHSLATAGGIPMWVRDAELGLDPGEPASCRAGMPQFLPVTRDSVVCDANPHMTRHLVAATGSQNYGVNSYRIRQPFDFAGRTGRIVFDTDLAGNLLLGYVSVVIADDPAPTANWDVNGRGPNPRNGVIVTFMGANAFASRVEVHEVRDFATVATHSFPVEPAVAIQRGRLNRVEIRLSQGQLAVDVSGFSTDGVNFPPRVDHGRLSFATPLPFTRGHVHFLSHNHATWKYSGGDYGTPHPLRSWNTYWDNIGFDGPVVDTTREYEIADSNVAHTFPQDYIDADGQTITVQQPGHTIAYLVPNDPATLGAPLVFRGVSLHGATRARLVMTGYYQNWGFNLVPQAGSRLIYRINDHPAHERAFTAGEIAMLRDEAGQGGAMNHAIDVPLGELREGDNTFRFSTRELASGYPNAVANLDLLIDYDLQRVFGDSFE
jgi:hypothetical protein